MAGWSFKEHQEKVQAALYGMLLFGFKPPDLQLTIPREPKPDEQVTGLQKSEPVTCFGMKVVVDPRLPPDGWYISRLGSEEALQEEVSVDAARQHP